MAKGHRSQIKRERNAQKDMRANAHVKNAPVSETKAKVILDSIRGKKIVDAMGILRFSPRKAATVVEKVLVSAVANAQNNLGLDIENLVIAETYATKGLKLKRFRAGAMGKAKPRVTQKSHIYIILDEK